MSDENLEVEFEQGQPVKSGIPAGSRQHVRSGTEQGRCSASGRRDTALRRRA